MKKIAIFALVFLFSALNATSFEECQGELDTFAQCTQRKHYENGKLKAEIPFAKGAKEGIAKEYDENGELIGTIRYRNNQPISGKCENGKVLTNAHLYNIDQGLSTLSTICQ